MGTAMDKDGYLMPLRVIMSTLGNECQELGLFVDQLQYSLSPILDTLKMDERCHQDVQALDALSQRLASLAGYIKEISKILPQELHVDARDALASVSMSELQHRLKGLSLPLVPEHAAGDLDLF